MAVSRGQLPETDERELNRLRRLKWITILAPAAFLGLLEILRSTRLHGFFNSLPGKLTLGGVIIIAAQLFSQFVFSAVGTIQRRLTQQNQELRALQEASMAVTSALDLETVLQRVVDEARELGSASYGALALVGDDGLINTFLTSGITPEVRERIGPEPIGKGLLGAPIQSGRSIRLEKIAADERSVGFPPDHPPMRSLLAVPIIGEERITGSLYLANDQAGSVFSAADQARLERFASQAAVAIENARLHRQVRAFAVAEERDRIAREMHDSLAQVLGYVNTKAQAVRELLRTGQIEPAQEQLDQLSSAAREAYTDVRENILGLRVTQERDERIVELLQLYAEQWQDQSGIRICFDAAKASRQVRLSPIAELQLLRIVQEALANVRKHASAANVELRVTLDQGELVVVLTDDGIGFDPASSARGDVPRFGLKIMEERAESVNGVLMVESALDDGTSITVRLPAAGRSNVVMQEYS